MACQNAGWYQIIVLQTCGQVLHLFGGTFSIAREAGLCKYSREAYIIWCMLLSKKYAILFQREV
jgi:hypothetical protein